MLVKSGRNLDVNNNKNFNVGDERSGMQVPIPPERCGGGDEELEGEDESEIRPHFDEIDFHTQPVKVTGFLGLQ